ncbi:hypothetical protein ACJMK2_032931 [Sinanodonta woodiana]|uniref:Transmembrane protein n=1 Tax=Sinanodonta woodiana TaxID=1069815 RepID=A0ABD3X4S8_SINWO
MDHGKGVDEVPVEKPKKSNVSECLVICWATSFLCLCVILVLVLLGLGIAKIVIGATYLRECELQYMIPIFLIVSGVSPILSGGGARRNNENKNTAGTICALIGLFFNTSWTIAGSVWVYPTWDMIKNGKNIHCATNSTSCKTCNDVVLTFAFAMVTVDWIIIGLVLFIIFCSVCATVRK